MLEGEEGQFNPELSLRQRFDKARNKFWDKRRFPESIITTATLPESPGSQAEIDEVLGRIEHRRRMGKREKFNFEAVLPYTIGEVPPEDRAAFDTFLGGEVDVTRLFVPNSPQWEELRKATPGFIKILEIDLARFDPSAKFSLGQVDRFPLPNTTSTAAIATYWHIDSGLVYTVANKMPTDFLAGKVGYERVDREGLIRGKDRKMVKARADSYQIVRMDPETVHKKPEETQTEGEGFKTRVDVMTTIK